MDKITQDAAKLANEARKEGAPIAQKAATLAYNTAQSAAPIARDAANLAYKKGMPLALNIFSAAKTAAMSAANKAKEYATAPPAPAPTPTPAPAAPATPAPTAPTPAAPAPAPAATAPAPPAPAPAPNSPWRPDEQDLSRPGSSGMTSADYKNLSSQEVSPEKEEKEEKDPENPEVSIFKQLSNDFKEGNFPKAALIPPLPSGIVMQIIGSLNQLFQENFPKVGKLASIYIDKEVLEKENELKLNEALAEQVKKTDLDKHMDVYIKSVLNKSANQ